MSDVNWWLMLLAFLLGAVITWFWSVRRVSREVPRTAVERDHGDSGGVGAKVAGAGAGVAGAAAGAAAWGSRDDESDLDNTTRRADLDHDLDATTRRGDLEVDRPVTEVYDRTADDTQFDGTDPDAATVQRSSLHLPEAPAPAAESHGVGGSAAGAATAGVAGLGAASWSARDGATDDAEPVAASHEPVRFAGAGATAADTGSPDDVVSSSDAEIIEAEADLETPAAPTGEADWSTATGADSDADATEDLDDDLNVGADPDDRGDLDDGGDADAGAGETPDANLDLGTATDTPLFDGASASSPKTSVMAARDAGDLAAAREPVTHPTGTDTSGTDTSGTDTSSADAEGDGSPSATSTPAATGVAGLAAAGAGDRGGDRSADPDASADAAVTTGKFGKGSADPGADGSGPEGWAIKGNEDSMLFHTKDSPSYKRTRAEVWFEDEDTARKAGFTKWNEKNRTGTARGSRGAAKVVAIPEGKFGKGSADPGPDGSGPEGWTIKGNEDSNLFHTQDSPSFGRTKAEIWFDTEESARGAGFIRWDEKDRSRDSAGSVGAAKLVAIPEGRFGKGSADPEPDGSGPEGWAIKGNEDSMLFHTQDSPAYGRTKAEVWFEDENSARTAGFTKWNERRR